MKAKCEDSGGIIFLTGGRMSELKSIEEEALDCRAAFEGVKVGAVVKNCHHDRLLELLSEPAEERIVYILRNKPEEEQARRLREFRPWPYPLIAEWSKACAEWRKACAEWDKAAAEWDKADAEWDKACAEWSKADAEPAIIAQLHSSFPDTTWNGKSIFGDGRQP